MNKECWVGYKPEEANRKVMVNFVWCTRYKGEIIQSCLKGKAKDLALALIKSTM